MLRDLFLFVLVGAALAGTSATGNDLSDAEVETERQATPPGQGYAAVSPFLNAFLIRDSLPVASQPNVRSVFDTMNLFTGAMNRHQASVFENAFLRRTPSTDPRTLSHPQAPPPLPPPPQAAASFAFVGFPFGTNPLLAPLSPNLFPVLGGSSGASPSNSQPNPAPLTNAMPTGFFGTFLPQGTPIQPQMPPPKPQPPQPLASLPFSNSPFGPGFPFNFLFPGAGGPSRPSGPSAPPSFSKLPDQQQAVSPQSPFQQLLEPTVHFVEPILPPEPQVDCTSSDDSQADCRPLLAPILS